tara:strand:+ start:15882 stop:17066 length:1185 start_codon:yes stop_codon:yes gene_type:complete
LGPTCIASINLKNLKIKVKILIVIDTLASGGAQKLKLQLAKGLLSRNFDVEIFIYDSNYPFYEKELKKAGIKINVFERKSSGFSFDVLRNLRNLILSSQYEFVISSLHAPSIYAALATIGLSKTKLIVCEESSSNATIPRLKKYLFYLSTLLADYLIVNSFNEKKLVKKLPGRFNKTKVIWNGLDIKSIKFSVKKIEKSAGIKKILVVGRVAYPKNGLNFLKALSLFESRNKWLPEITWIGRRDEDLRSSKDFLSINMQNEMDSFLNENKSIKNKWNWIESVDNIYDYYEDTDALIIPSIYEGLPMVLCEAMLSGCFVIASSVCDHPLIIGDNLRGLLCDPLSPESICRSIEKLNNMDPKLKSIISKRAREFAVKNFDLNEMLNKYEDLIIQNK